MGAGFRDLTVWKKAYDFALAVYQVTKAFPKTELFGLANQIKRAAVSVSANIAEGYERQYRKEYVQFLMIAKGSLAEVETYLMFARDLTYINEDAYAGLEGRRKDVDRLLRALIKSLR